MRREHAGAVRCAVGDCDLHDLGGRIDLGGVDLARAAVTTVCPDLAYGYLRVRVGSSDTIAGHRATVATMARSLELMLSTVFVDARVCREWDRPAFRTMVDAVRALRPRVILVPSAWHLASRPRVRAEHLDELRPFGCTVLAADGRLPAQPLDRALRDQTSSHAGCITGRLPVEEHHHDVSPLGVDTSNNRTAVAPSGCGASKGKCAVPS